MGDGSPHAVLPLGCDRLHRRYWVFPNVSGVVVEAGYADAGYRNPDLPVDLPPPSEYKTLVKDTEKLLQYLRLVCYGT